MLAMFAENSIEVLPGFAGTDVDEMAIDYIKSVYACISRGSVAVDDTRGQLLYACSLTPASMWFSGLALKNLPVSTVMPIAESGTSFYPAPVFALAQTCELWRGGFKFRIKMAKTKFHAGRLILGFVPVDPKVNSSVFIPTDLDALQFTSMIWDLREGNTIEFEVPFVSPYSYLDFAQNYGTFFMSVIEPLAAPDTVAQTIDFVVEVAGASDFEVAFPTEIRFPRSPADTLYVAQSGLQVAAPPPDHASTVCIGEQVLSLKQFVSRGCLYDVVDTSGPNIVSGNDILPTWSPNASSPVALAGPRYDYFNYIQGFFGLQRGGVCFSAIANDVQIGMSAYLPTGNGFTAVSTPIVSEVRAPLHVKVPFYCKVSRALVRPDFVQGAVPAVNLCTSFPTGLTTAKVATFIRASDDYQAGYFLGAPPLAFPFTSRP